MNDNLPQYIITLLRRTHGFKFNEWMTFRYPALPHSFTVYYCSMMAMVIGFELYFSPMGVSASWFLLLIEVLIVDVTVYWSYTNVRLVVALRKLKNGEDWKEIKTDEIQVF